MLSDIDLDVSLSLESLIFGNNLVTSVTERDHMFENLGSKYLKNM